MTPAVGARARCLADGSLASHISCQTTLARRVVNITTRLLYSLLSSCVIRISARRATSGTSKRSMDSEGASHDVATMWSLLRDGEEVRRRPCL